MRGKEIPIVVGDGALCQQPLKEISYKTNKRRTQNESHETALVYCRVSTPKQKIEGTGLDSQVAACVAVAERLGYKVGRITREVYSGAELLDRPQLARDRADIRAGRFHALIVYSIDRLSRDMAHLAIISNECERAGCRLIFVTEVFKETPERNPSDSDDAYFAEIERQTILERMGRGRRAKLMKGQPVFGGWELYGYRHDRASGTYKIDEQEAAVVRRIFSMCAAGCGTHSIASKLNREGLPSPKVSRRPGARWTQSTLCRILNTKSYIGEEYCLRTRRVARKRDLPRPESEWVRLPDGIRPPIISLELWETCQEKIRARAQKTRRREERPALLRGHIFCASCGAHMIRNHFKRGKYEYDKYRCGSRWRPFATDCRGEGVTVSVIHGWVWEEVKSILLDPNMIEEAIKNAQQTDPQLILDLQAAKRELAHTNRNLEVLLSCLSRSENDTILRPFIEREIKQASRKKQQLEKVIAEIEVRVDGKSRHIADLLYLKDSAIIHKNLDEFTFEERRMALRTLGIKVYANGDNAAYWRYEINLPALAVYK